MHFCSECGNMYYVRISEDDDNKLIYYCRNCGHEDDIMDKDNICVAKTQVSREKQKYTHAINEYTKYDPTLPRINTIKCPTHQCDSNRDPKDKSYKEREVIYLRYDDINMKYIYLCPVCDTIWKTAEET